MPPIGTPDPVTITDREQGIQIAVGHLIETYFDGATHSLGTSPALQDLEFPAARAVHGRIKFDPGDGPNAIHYNFTDSEWVDEGSAGTGGLERSLRCETTVTFFARVCTQGRDDTDQAPVHTARRIGDRLELLLSSSAAAALTPLGLSRPQLVTASRPVASPGFAVRRLAYRLTVRVLLRVSDIDPLTGGPVA